METNHNPRIGDRSLFPKLSSPIYLNHSAVAPISKPVEQALAEVISSYAAEGLGAVFPCIDAREALRAELAAFFGGRAEDYGFVQNTTMGVIDVAFNMPWMPGDRVVLFEGEFPANTTPWQRAARHFGLEIVWISADALADPSGKGEEALEDALRSGVRLVAISAVQFQTGWRAPLTRLAERCHAHGAELFVDGIQACGAVPIDVEATGVDYLVCGGHKWMMGLEGAGFIYIRPERMARLRLRLAGWLSHEDALTFLSEGAGHLRYDRPVRREASFLEVGSVSALGYAALQTSLGMLAELGVEAIFDHIQAYLDPLEAGLVERGLHSRRAERVEHRSGILSVTLPEGLELKAVAAALGERGVACSTPDGHLRFAPHWPNALDEVPRVLEAVDAALVALRE